MRVYCEWVDEDVARWDALWTGLGNLGELSNREAEIVADTARRGIAANFEQERAPSGTPWVPLAPMTQRQRREGIDHRGIPFRVGAAHPILKRTGDLKASFVDPRHPRNVTEIERGGGITFLLLSAEDDPDTPDRIATLHAGGTAYGMAIGARMVAYEVPARPFIGLSDRDLDRVEEQAERVIWQRVERLGVA